MRTTRVTVCDLRLPQRLAESSLSPSENTTVVPAEEFDVLDPATQNVIARVTDTRAEHWNAALSVSVHAHSVWKKVAPRQRSEALHAIFKAMCVHSEDFATTITMEMGKPLAESRGEVSYGAEYFRWFAEEAVRLPGRITSAPAGNGTILVTRTPVGPVLAITPWNFPLAMAARKIAPALAAGCPILVKPAEETPLTMLLLEQIIRDIVTDIDPELSGLVQIIPTTDAKNLSRTLMADQRLKKVTFTGSTAVGKVLVEQSAQHLLRTSMELGGNAPFLITEDADLTSTLQCAMQAKMRNGGEACIAANRFLVHESRIEEFTAQLVEYMVSYSMGHGMDASTTLGPLINSSQQERIHSLVSDALSRGAHILCGGEIPNKQGFFYPPTVLRSVPQDARILHEEIFGPVSTITSFRTLDEGIAMANNTSYGLAAYGFSENVHTCQRLAEELEAGMVGINRGAISDAAAPFGGIKESGFGREGGVEGIEEYLETKYIAL